MFHIRVPRVEVILMWFCLNVASGKVDLQQFMTKFSQTTSKFTAQCGLANHGTEIFTSIWVGFNFMIQKILTWESYSFYCEIILLVGNSHRINEFEMENSYMKAM